MVVVGAGIIGLSCAWRLSNAGLRVTIFDSRESAAEASWAGAGMLAPGGEIEGHSSLAELALRSLRLYPDFIRELESETGSGIDFQQCGACELAASYEESEELRKRAERQHAIGIESEPARYGAFDARYYPADATVDPRDVTAALRTACIQSGCVLREYEPVVSVDDGGQSVRTARETIHDDEGTLITAGAWSSQLCAKLPQTKPVRGHLVAWQLEPNVLPHILRRGHTYLLQRRNGIVIGGSSTEDVGFDRNIDPSIVADIRERCATLLPALRDIEPCASWIGFRPVITSGAGSFLSACPPLIGRAGERLWAAFGHYRNGILLAPETARLLVEDIAGSR